MAYLDTQHEGLSTPVNLEADHLIRARALIADPERWTIRAFARDAEDKVLWDANARQAIKWCANGAVIKVTGRYSSSASTFLARAAEKLGVDDPSEINNYRGHAATLEMFDKAIEMAKAQ